MNIREAFESVILPTKKGSIRPGTISASRAALKWFILLVPEVASLEYGKVSNRHLIEFRGAWPEQAKLAPQTFNKYLRHIRSIFRDLEEFELIAKVPRCRELPEDDPDVRIAKSDEIERIYVHCESAKWPQHPSITAPEYWRALVAVACGTGLRRSDLWNIRAKNVDLSDKYITYRAVKTSKKRVIPLAEFACDHLAGLMKKLNPRDDDFLFYSTVSRRQFYREWHRIQDSAGIKEHYDLHDLRRTCGSRVFLHSGLNAASELLAHSSVAVTRKHYVGTNAAAESLRLAIGSIPDPARQWKEMVIND